MSFENYKVAVKISLVNEVSAGLLLISKQFGVAGKVAEEFQKRLNSIKETAKTGAMLVGGGVALAAPFIYAIDKAAELQKQMIGIQIATRGTVGDMNNMRKAIEGIASQTVFSNIDIAKMAKIVASGTGLGAKDVQGLLPEYAKFADVQLLMKGTSYQSSVTDAIRLAHTAQHYDPQSLSKYLDLLTKASFIVPGGLGEVGHALKYSQGMAKTALGIDDDQMVIMTALLNRLGFAGSRGGTNLIAAMTRTIPGIFGSGLLTGKSGEALKEMNFVDNNGHSNIFKDGKFDSFLWMGRLSEYVAREFASHPEAIARQDIMKNFQHAFGTQGSRIASILSDPKALDQLKLIGQTFGEYGGVDSMQKKFADESVAQQYMNAKTNFMSAMTELGVTLLPLASKGLKALNSHLQTLITWITANPEKVKRLAYAFLGLSAAMMFSGTVLLMTSAMRGLGLALLFNGVGGTGGAVGIRALAAAIGGGGAGTLVGGLLLLGGVVYGMSKILTAVGGDGHDPKNHPGQKWMVTGHGGHWAIDNSLSQEHAGQHWVHGTRGSGGTWVADTVKPNNGNKTIQVHTKVVMPNGRVLAEAVTHEQTKAASRPASGITSFDPSQMQMQPNFNIGNN